MEKLRIEHILVKGAILKTERLDGQNLLYVKRLVAETRQRQKNVLKLKSVDEARLKKRVQV